MSKISVQYNKKSFSDEQNELIDRALAFALEAHVGQLRKSGRPYITHPIAVAETVAAWGLDHEAVVAALLHDVVEDTAVTHAAIEREFGETIAQLVEGVTKLAEIEAMGVPDESSIRLEATQENLRKLLLATAKDFRVIVIKLADRLHNLRTLKYLDEERQRRIARESLDIFAPLADRLGMGQVKTEIEDLSFRYWLPDEYTALSRRVASSVRASRRYLDQLKAEVTRLVRSGGVEPVSVEGRQKHLYSVYKKLSKTGGELDKIYDLIAIRIIVPDVASCYQALGAIHQEYKPLIYRIKDYIAVPKPNGYQSLHTTVFALDGRITEIQIRTPQMHEEAEHGLAAHFYYDAHKASEQYASGASAAALPKNLAWVSELSSLGEAASGQDFGDSARLELFSDRIFVFSPRGDLYELPEGATPVDFAFAVHSNVGLRALGARVNGRLVTLDSRLENRDVVEILTRKEPAPNRDWLSYVKTSHARSRIKAWFRALSRDANIASGRQLLESELKIWGYKRLEEVGEPTLSEVVESYNLRSIDDLLAQLGEGGLGLLAVVRRIVPAAAKPNDAPTVRRSETTGRVVVGDGTISGYNLAACCKPTFPQRIVGYITRGRGVTVHTLSCPNLPNDSERYVTCTWETLASAPERLVCKLQIVAQNRIGMLADVASLCSRRQINLGAVKSAISDDGRESEINLVVEVPDLFELAELVKQLERLSGVLHVTRA